MCRTVHALLQTVICGIQMLVRVFMTIILMIENLIRMILQTLYNFISFMLQMLSLIPICIVFLLTARLKCFMCGGGGGCAANRGGSCDCLMSAVAIIILYFILKHTHVLDKIFYQMGYNKVAPPSASRLVPTTGTITECSREVTNSTGTTRTTHSRNNHLRAHGDLEHYENNDGDEDYLVNNEDKKGNKERGSVVDIIRHFNLPTDSSVEEESDGTETQPGDLTTILYYLV